VPWSGEVSKEELESCTANAGGTILSKYRLYLLFKSFSLIDAEKL
jgi:hypothetical protein